MKLPGCQSSIGRRITMEQELMPVSETVVETVIEKPSYVVGGTLVVLSGLGIFKLGELGVYGYKRFVKGEKSTEEVLMDLKTENALLKQKNESFAKKSQEDFNIMMEVYEANKKKKEEEAKK